MTRQQLLQLIQTNIPDNNAKEISAEKLREVLEAINDFKFHLDEDELRQQLFNAIQTLDQRLQGLPIERRAIIGPYSFDAPATQTIPTQTDPDGIILTASRQRVSTRDMLIRVEFTEPIIGKDVKGFNRLVEGQNPSQNGVMKTTELRRIDGQDTSASVLFAISRTTTSGVGNHLIEIVLK